MKPSHKRSKSLIWTLATATFLVAAVNFHVPAHASEEADPTNFDELNDAGEVLGSQELDQLRGEGLDIAPTYGGDPEVGVAVQLWDDLRQGRQTSNAAFTGTAYEGEASRTINGVLF